MLASPYEEQRSTYDCRHACSLGRDLQAISCPILDDEDNQQVFRENPKSQSPTWRPWEFILPSAMQTCFLRLCGRTQRTLNLHDFGGDIIPMLLDVMVNVFLLIALWASGDVGNIIMRP